MEEYIMLLLSRGVDQEAIIIIEASEREVIPIEDFIDPGWTLEAELRFVFDARSDREASRIPLERMMIKRQ